MFVQTSNYTLIKNDNGRFGLTLDGFGRILSYVQTLYPPLTHTHMYTHTYTHMWMHATIHAHHAYTLHTQTQTLMNIHTHTKPHPQSTYHCLHSQSQQRLFLTGAWGMCPEENGEEVRQVFTERGLH